MTLFTYKEIDMKHFEEGIGGAIDGAGLAIEGEGFAVRI